MALQRRMHSLIAIVLTALSLGCSNDPKRNNGTEYDQANKEITDGNYNSAISVMTSRLQDNPYDQQARILLASAYAARGGVFMGDYFSVATKIIRQLEKADEVLDNQFLKAVSRLERNTADKSQRSLLNTYSKVYVATFRISQLITVVDMIPTLSERGRRDVAFAVEALEGDPNIRGGGALYEGLLRIILLKNNLGPKYDLAYLHKCEVDLNRLILQLQDMQADVSGIMSAISRGMTDANQARKLRQQAQKIDKSFEDAQSVVFMLGMFEVDMSDLSDSLGGNCKK